MRPDSHFHREETREDPLARLFSHLPEKVFHPKLTFPLTEETDEAGNDIRGDSYWIALTKDGKIQSEGKLFLPEHTNNQSHLVLLTPGMPGETFCRFAEKRFVNPLLQEGNSVLVLRHLGTWMNTISSKEFIACPERERRGKSLRQETLGEQKPYDFRELVGEVTEALRTLGPFFERISLIGHSSGALGEALALQEIPEEIQQKIRHFLSLAGFVGGTEHLRWWLRNRIMFTIYLWQCQEVIHLKSPSLNTQKLEEMFRELYRHTLPPHIMPISIHTPEDELIHPLAAERYRQHNGRGLHIIDQTEDPCYHKLNNLQAETLLRLLQIYHPNTNHTVTCTRREPLHYP